MSVTLDYLLAPLDQWLNDPTVEELCVNKPNEVWVYSRGGYACHPLVLGADDIEDIAIVAAAQRTQDVSEIQPLLMTDLEGRGRLNAIMEPCVARGFPSLTIRKGSEDWPTMAGLAAGGLFRNTRTERREKTASNGRLLELYHAKEWAAFFTEAVRAGKNILGCGVTASGKTHFLKAALAELQEIKRILTIQNTPELTGLEKMFPNSVQLYYDQEGGIHASKLVEMAMRMRPNLMVLQEILDGEAAKAFLFAMQTGHSCMSTIHADHCEAAFDRIRFVVKQSSAGAAMIDSDVDSQLRNLIDVVVHSTRDDGPFEVDEIWFREARS